jgi:small conductance mechanosensitive channel
VRTAVVQNFSRAENRRIELSIGVGYNDDLGKAISAITAVLESEPRLLKAAPILVKTKALTDSAVVVLARCTTKASDFESTLFDLTRAIKERLAQEGIDLPAQKPVVYTQLAPPAPAKLA